MEYKIGTKIKYKDDDRYYYGTLVGLEEARKFRNDYDIISKLPLYFIKWDSDIPINGSNRVWAHCSNDRCIGCGYEKFSDTNFIVDNSNLNQNRLSECFCYILYGACRCKK